MSLRSQSNVDTDEERHWPASKFGYKTDDLYTTLHSEFNTVPFAILDLRDFSHEVQDTSNQASSRAEFRQLLEERSQKRVRSLQANFSEAADYLAADPSLFPSEIHWERFLQLSREPSLHHLVSFFKALQTTAPGDKTHIPTDAVAGEHKTRGDVAVARPHQKSRKRSTTRPEHGRVTKKRQRAADRPTAGAEHRYNLRSKRHKEENAFG
ncbi:hypothetical protein LZ32DRAFT_606245 [Colletotrichum eremochloae]|nr:hypothetical protein LZ32DRAFT_606245 [Colletotrichum eremochloae]